MAANTDTGHIKNVTNLETLISVVITLGDAYNPSKDSLKIPALQSLHSSANQAMVAFKNAESAKSTAIDVRELAFQPTGSLFTRVSNALKASGSSAQADETAKTIFRKLQGKRAGAKLTDEEKAAILEKGRKADAAFNDLILRDAKKEFSSVAKTGFGIDGDEEVRNADFAATRGTFDEHPFVVERQNN